MSEPFCRWSAVRRLSPRRPDGRSLPGWHHADLVFSLADGGLAGVAVRRRLWLWSSLSAAVAAALVANARPARLELAAPPPPRGATAGRRAVAIPGRDRPGGADVTRLPPR